MSLSVGTVRGVLFRCGEPPTVVEVPNDLSGIRDTIGCEWVECAYSSPSTVPGVDLDVWCDEEGKLDGARPNRPACLYSGRLRHHGAGEDVSPESVADVLYGDFVVLGGDDDGETVSVPEADLATVGDLFPLACLAVYGDVYKTVPSSHLVRPREATDRGGRGAQTR